MTILRHLAVFPRTTSRFTSTQVNHFRVSKRFYNTQQPPSPTKEFYRTFARPVGKTALLAVLVYQMVYYAWTRLEYNEIKEERQEMQDSTHSRQWLTSPLLEATPRVAHRKKTAEIASLEAEVRSLHAAALAAKKQAATMASSGDVADARSKGAGKKWWWPW